MSDRELLDRIGSDPAVLGGKPVIKGTRLSVEYVLSLLAHGATQAEIIAEYDGVDAVEIQACLLFASRSLEEISFMPLSTVVP